MATQKITFCLAALLICGCSSNDLGEIVVDCAQSTLELSSSSVITTNASGCNAADGALVIAATGGESPYTYMLGSVTNTTGSFDGLSLGNYEVKVLDGNNCERSINVDVLVNGATLNMTFALTADTECLSNNGSIEATGSGGTAPYEFKIGLGSFSSTTTFTSLAPNTYSVEMKDSQGCSFTKTATVQRGNTGVSFAAQIQPIINTKCALTGCHNGDNGAQRNWTVFANFQANAANIKTRTGNGSMPLTGSLTQDQINLIACWVDDGAQNN